MEDLIYIIVLFVLPIVTFIAFYFNKKATSDKKKLILVTVALLIYQLGLFTPLSTFWAIVIVYLIFIFLLVRNQRIKKAHH